MSESTPDNAAEFSAACTQNAAEVGQALSRALGGRIEVAAGEPLALSLGDLPADLTGAGLLISFKWNEGGAAAFLSEASGLIPAWYASPDPTGVSKLNTLAQELSMLLFPEELGAEGCQACKAPDMGAALGRGGVVDGAGLLPLSLKVDEQFGTLYLIWPIPNADDLIAPAETDESAPQATAPVGGVSAESLFDAPPPPATSTGDEPEPPVEDFDRLPPYTRSMLRIKVPVMVTLASKKQAIAKIVEMGPGTIIKFHKSCDEMLELEVGGHRIALGEAVKIGDKFGLRINSIIMPEERFKKVDGRRL